MKIIDELNKNEQVYDSVVIDNVSITYYQEKDTDDSNNTNQNLTINTANNGVEMYITITTNRWAIDSIDDFILILNDFKRRSGIKNL